MKVRGIRLVAAIVALTTLALVGTAATATAKPPNTGGTLTSTVSGTASSAGQTVGTATGTFTPTRFQASNGQLLATGQVTVTVTDLAGNVIGTASQTVTDVVTQADATCQILNLTLGPLDLNLLGLVIHLDTVHLTITAVSGPGNLLGNLLCAIAGLLNQPGGLSAVLTQIASLLNQILALLGGL